MKKNKDEITIKDLADIFLPKLWLVLIVAVVFSAAFGLYSALCVKDTYTSSSTMYVYRTSSSTTSADMTTAEEMVEVYKVILMSDDLLNKIVNELPEKYDSLGLSAGYLRSVISLSSLGRGTFRISITTLDPEFSYDLARCVHDLATAEMLSIPNALMIHTIQEAKRPTAPNGKNEISNAAIGFVIGAVLALIVIWVIHALDVVIRNKKRIEDDFDLPVLGVIPLHIPKERAEEDE